MMGGFLSSAMSLYIHCTFITLTLVIEEEQLSVSEPMWWDAPSTEAYGNLTGQQEKDEGYQKDLRSQKMGTMSKGSRDYRDRNKLLWGLETSVMPVGSLNF